MAFEDDEDSPGKWNADAFPCHIVVACTSGPRVGRHGLAPHHCERGIYVLT